jgi:FemAB-related protein (PEP-CTERM system-associated)
MERVQVATEVQQITPDFYAAWDTYVAAHSLGTPFHLIGWKKTIETVFRYEPLYLAAVSDGRIRGILPLFLVKNFLMGRALISSPFAVYGGILADSDEIKAAIGEHLKELGRRLRVRHIELRNAYPEQCLGSSNVSRYVTFTRPVTGDEEELLGSVHKKTRNMVRKALRSSFTSRCQTSDYRAFENLLSRNLRRLGTPNFPPKLFPALLQHFAGSIDIREVLLGQNVVAASMNFFFKGHMHTYYAASDPRYLPLAPNDFMYFDHLRWAGQNGYSIFDFGRSKKNTGTFEFKRHWGTQMRELPYEVLLVESKELPNFSPQNPRFQLAIKIWQNLPLPVTRLLGPPIVRLFP